MTSKYALVGRRLEGRTGTLVDLGARDRILAAFLPPGISYLSCDAEPSVPPHDYAWNLEERIPAGDRSFTYVAALDVLEHLDHLHAALDEMLRITDRTFFASFPNLAALSHRLEFFVRGTMGGKYALSPEPIRDRHRWITTARQARSVMKAFASRRGFLVREHPIFAGFGRLQAVLASLPLPADLAAYTILFELDRVS